MTLDLQSSNLQINNNNNWQPYHPAAQDWLPTEAKQGWAGQYLDGRPPGKARLLLVEVLVRPAGSVCSPCALCGS